MPITRLFRHGLKRAPRSLQRDAARVASIKVVPENPVVPRAGLLQQFRVLATYDNGEIRDVTSDAFIDCSNIEIAKMHHGE